MSGGGRSIRGIEQQAKDLRQIKAFDSTTSGSKFTDKGPSYTSFSESGIDGGFELSTGKIVNGVLVVLYHRDLHEAKSNVQKFGGTISEDIFEFPGGRRFHFIDPSGNELAVWSDK